MKIEDTSNVEEMAVKLDLAFYDASYICVAHERGLTLIMEDEEMGEKAVEMGSK